MYSNHALFLSHHSFHWKNKGALHGDFAHFLIKMMQAKIMTRYRNSYKKNTYNSKIKIF